MVCSCTQETRTVKLFRRKVISGCDSRGDAESPYLTRYTLLETRRGSLCLHVFHRSDADVMHDHPWSFVSLILWRGYREHTPRGVRRYWPGMLLFRSAEHIHRVELIEERPAVTLVLRGNFVREWGFWTARGWQSWRDYFAENACK